ncbi:bifunctional phosphoribosyl-AMP cyclohydrolase/phosphoribosyl-ATP diphosphatase HisIE [Pseudalkalibacillus hwajinpoensis]|uniref:bifunctional phosphoribosyl-AMP cyclohydrolase/phosphoribosyl-ATP diphosphatase HisIE n=1 Tax=Guptibacillus hwajinpoensis TaxID=208199 RepID=UPI001CD76C93|nr:bifunctional phosphoribosyl-AMP cyclohydrolase/phosphoribosyl-ATP diphosphatase HisIE [Pseudalkalibacillus hwajinpoensis]MCA0991656.1 bifunctional phosphoribosyl-AMP cyclohydrolase/phosphoribosyl-ATP diphosphatase HisIE [Pseudalkalibacillus hwajinpoensis]
MNTEMIQFDEKGLVPAIVQDVASKEVLTLAYMNKESLTKTIETKETWFYSRSREELWHKGETSGNTQTVLDLRYDCDQDAVLVLVNPEGPACHKGTYSCFSESLLSEEPKSNGDRFAILNTLEQTIAKREAERPDGAYTTYLFNEGVDKILKKVGEEASEVIIAAKNRDHQELTWESADLIFHLMVLLREQECALDDVLQVLEERHASK